MTPKKRLTIATLIALGYSLTLFAVVAFSWYAIAGIERIKDLSRDLYIHPFTVSNAAAELKGTLFQLRNHMVQIVMIRNRRDNADSLIAEAELFDRQTRQHLAIIKENFLGDMGRVDALERRLDEWDDIRRRIVAAVQAGDFKQAERLVREEGSPKFFEIVPEVGYVLSFARNKGQFFAQAAEEETATIQFRVLASAILLAVSLLITTLVVLWRVRFLQGELDRQASTDFLTGLANRRRFMEQVAQEQRRTQRYRTPFALAIVDLDWFKQINDNYGHDGGDQVLRHFAALCRARLRTSDLVGRIGGEEFGILLPNSTLASAQEILDRLRQSLEQTPVQLPDGREIKFTASFGVASCCAPEEDSATLFREADRALYAAKHAGRNQVSTAD